jgi:hypothetical protein
MPREQMDSRSDFHRYSTGWNIPLNICKKKKKKKNGSVFVFNGSFKFEAVYARI